MCKRMHQTVGNVLRTLVHENKPRGSRQAKNLANEALGIAQHSLICGLYTTLGSSPGSLVFNGLCFKYSFNRQLADVN